MPNYNYQFINYSHPSEQTNSENRRKVASYIGIHFRNRSKPLYRSTINSTLNAENQHYHHPYFNWTWTRHLQLSGRDHPVQAVVTGPPPQNINLNTTISLPPHPTEISRDRHGLRTDPFYSYPVDYVRASIPRAVDYWIHIYGPTHLIRPNLLSPDQGTSILQSYFQYALHDPVLFEALVAVSQANLSVQSWENTIPNTGVGASTTRLDRDTLYHYGQTVQRLRGHLAKENGYQDDSVLLAIIALIAVNYLSNDMDSLEMHLKGVRRIVALRGGIDKVGWPLILKPYLISIESFWGYISRNADTNTNLNINTTSQTHHENQDPSNPPIRRVDDSLSQHDNDNTTHCPTPLSSKISFLPTGFSRLAVTHQLSPKIINLLYRIVVQQDHINAIFTAGSAGDVNGANLEEIETCMRLLGRSDLSLIERVCCMGVMIRLTDPGRLSGRISAIYEEEVKRHAEGVLGWQVAFEEDEDLMQCFLWLAMCMAVTMVSPKGGGLVGGVREDARFRLLMAVARWYHREGVEWDEVKRILDGFFTIDEWWDGWERMWRMMGEEIRRQNHDLQV